MEYDELTPDMLVVMDLNGNQVEGDLNPSSDTKTHLELYKAFPALGGVVHTHSTHAVAWAQARRDIPAVRHHPCRRHFTARCPVPVSSTPKRSRKITRKTPAR